MQAIDFGGKLKALREERGISINSLSYDCRIPVANIYSMKSNKRSVPDSFLEKISDLYGVDFDYLKALKIMSKATPDQLELIYADLKS